MKEHIALKLVTLMSFKLILFRNIFPLVGSNNLGIIFIIVDFPVPELPTKAFIFSPFKVQEKLLITLFSFLLYLKHIF